MPRRLGCLGGGKKRVVIAASWDELPDVLEPGVYIVGGEVHTIEEDAPKEAVARALKYKRMGKTLL